MTNAEKLAKNTEKLSTIMSCSTLKGSCTACPLHGFGVCSFCRSPSDLERWLKSEAKEEKLAIWGYDNFPFFKIGLVTFEAADGTVEIKGYDGMRFKAIKTIPYDKVLVDEYKRIVNEYNEKERALRNEALQCLNDKFGLEN